MNKKIIFIILAIINFLACTLSVIFLLPENIPFLLNLREIIVFQISKWIMLISAILPTIFITIALLVKSKKTQFLLKTLFIWSIFDNILYFCYFTLGTRLSVGELSEIPISISIFMPISVILMIFSIKLKSRPYLSKPSIYFKVTRETEFIWKQTHFYARDTYFFTSFVLFIVSIVFSFIRFPLIELLIYVLLLTISTILIYFYSRSIYKKYMEMKTKKDRLDSKNTSINK